MRGLSLFGRNADSQPSRNDPRNEQGYLLVGAAILILIIVAALSSYSFTIRRDTNYKSFYAAGERFSEIVAAAHFHAQQAHYNTGGTSIENCNLLNDMDLPEGYTLTPIQGTTFAVEVCGRDLAPISAITPNTVKAASAYVQLRIRGTRPASSDLIAFLAGAAAHGTERAGIIGQNAGGNCDAPAAAAVTRWGPDGAACLTSANITALGFGSVQNGDIIVPAWETALAKTEMAVIYRYPQPERPDMNAMTTDLHFAPSTIAGPVDCSQADAHCMMGVNETRTDNITAGGGTTVGSAASPGTFLVRQGSPASLQAVTVNDQPLRVYDQGGAATVMTVAGVVDLTGTTTNVGNTMGVAPGGHVDVTVVDPVYTDTLGAKTAAPFNQAPFDTTIESTVGLGPVSSRKIDKLTPGSMPGLLTTTKPNGQLGITGSLGNVGDITVLRNHAGDQLDVYAGTMVTNNTARATNATNDLPWDVGTIDQRGATAAQSLTLQSLDVRENCIGRACPDNVNEIPGGGI